MNNKIGQLQEKKIHYFLKNEYSNNIDTQEIKVGNYYADICLENQIIEIQTKHFNLLREKLKYYFEKGYFVKVVYPMINEKKICYVDATNNVVKVRNSPRKFNIIEVFYELYKIKSLLKEQKLSFDIVLLSVDETKEYQKKYLRYEQKYIERVPKKINETITIQEIKDYYNIIPCINEEFSAIEFAKICNTKLKYARIALNVLTYLNITKIVKINKRQNIYVLNKS